MSYPKNIFLVGPMGSGKTAVGRHLAQKLGRPFADSDGVIEERTGVDIPFIFEKEGEPGFRRRESDVIDELTQCDGLVLATGGGSVLDTDNLRNLSNRGVVVYLYCSPEQQHQRTLRDKRRPLLQTKDPLNKLRQLMEERDPLYRKAADLVVTTETRSASSVANETARKLNEA